MLFSSIGVGNDNKIKLLDIGCGRGHFIYLMKKKGWSVYGSELSPTSAMSAKKKVGDDVIFINDDLKETTDKIEETIRRNLK